MMEKKSSQVELFGISESDGVTGDSEDGRVTCCTFQENCSLYSSHIPADTLNHPCNGGTDNFQGKFQGWTMPLALNRMRCSDIVRYIGCNYILAFVFVHYCCLTYFHF